MVKERERGTKEYGKSARTRESNEEEAVVVMVAAVATR